MSKKGRPAVDSIAINVRMRAETVDRIDNARRNESDLPNRPEMVRRMVEDWLAQHEAENKGY